MNLKPGSIIKHYRLTELLGEGKTGLVYKAQDMHLLRPVVIKFLHSGHPDNKIIGKILENRALGIATITHPALCTLYEIDQSEGQPFIVMEYLQGPTLQEALDSGMLTRENIRKIVDILLDVFQVTHKSGQTLFIKAHNIFLCKDLSVKITDFNFYTKRHRDLHESEKMGKDGFENDPDTRDHAGSVSSTDIQRDIKSLGKLFYKMLSGDPLNSEHVTSGVRAHNLVRLQRSGDRAKWKRVLEKMLSLDPKERYPSIKAVKTDLNKKSTFNHLTDKRFLTGIAFVVSLLLVSTLYTSLNLFHDKPEKLYYLQRYEISTHSLQALNWFEKGQQAWWRYDLKRAIDCLEIATNIDSTFVYAHALNGVILRWEDYHDRASAAFDRVKQYCAHAPEWEQSLAKGFLGYHEEKPAKAHQAFQACLDHCPDLIDAYLGEALIYEVEKEYDKAIEATKKVVTIEPSHISAHSNVADLFTKLRQYDQAENWAENVVELIKTSGDTTGIENAYDLLGNIYRLNTKYPQAIAFLKKALSIAPLQRTNWGHLAETLVMDGQIRESEAALKQALNLPVKAMDLAELYAKLGYVTIFSGQFKKAVMAFGNARDISYSSGRFDQYIAFSQELTDLYYMMHNAEAVAGTKHIVDRLNAAQKKEYRDNIETLNTLIRVRLALLNCNKTVLESFVSNRMQTPLSTEFEITLFSEALMKLGQEDKAVEWFQIHETEAVHYLNDEKLVYDYHYSMFLHKTGNNAKALVRCNRILEHSCFYFTTDLYYIKTLVLLVDIYLSQDDHEMAEWYLHKFFDYWQFADHDILLYQEMVNKKMQIN